LLFIRSSELRFARWDEIDLHNAMWTIPAERERSPALSTLREVQQFDGL
jgi:integrase